MIAPRVDDAGEVLTLQRAAYVGESMVYEQFLPPLYGRPLAEVRTVSVAEEDVMVVLGLRQAGPRFAPGRCG